MATDKPTVRIKAATYENIYFDCPHCGKENIINRVTDLSPMATTSGMDMNCQDCGGSLWLNNDTIHVAKYLWFLHGLSPLKERKLYRDYVLTLCQGAESFFLQAVINKKLDREPIYRDDDGRINLHDYNPARRQYESSIRTYAFNPMRELFLETFRAEGENRTSRISRLREDRRQWAFATVKDSKINTLRNQVAHKNAYRPTLTETESHDELVTALYWLGEYLGVMDSTFIMNTEQL